MKRVTISLVTAFFLVNGDVSANSAAATVKTCRLADSVSSNVEVTKEQHRYDTDIYKLNYAGKTDYFFENEDGSRGGPVEVICAIGRKQRALVVWGEFTANYQQGFILVFNRATRKFERLDFAERQGPAWLYLSEHESIVVLPTDGSGENGSTPYVAYRHLKGSANQFLPKGIESPTPPAGYDVIEIQRR